VQMILLDQQRRLDRFAWPAVPPRGRCRKPPPAKARFPGPDLAANIDTTAADDIGVRTKIEIWRVGECFSFRYFNLTHLLHANF
jgi:hypothetical protein